MTHYEEICTAYKSIEPLREALDRAIRELPGNLLRAFHASIGAPSGSASLPTHVFGHPVGYTHLYHQLSYEDGTKKWEPCEPDNSFTVDFDGILSFTIGLCMEVPLGTLRSANLYFTITIEEIDQVCATLKIKNAAGVIKLNYTEQNGYEIAAAEIAKWIKDSLIDPKTALGPKALIGF